jgi:hypothetical protein
LRVCLAVFKSEVITSARQRAGLRAQERLANAEPDIAASFCYSMVDAHGEPLPAPSALARCMRAQQARPSYVGRVHPPPSWTDQDAYLASFAEGASNNRGDLTERPRRECQSFTAPVSGGRGVRDDAEVGH